MKEKENYFKTEDGYFIKENSKGWCFLPFEKFYEISEILKIAEKLKDLNSE